MQLEIYSWDSHLINDTTNYVAWFPRGAKKMPSSYPLWAIRSKTFPKLANKTLDGGILSFAIECRGTFHSQAETLNSWFGVDDFTPRRLIVKDKADSDRQWYVEGFPTEPVLAQDGGVSVFLITLALVEPLWRTVSGQSSSWSITASGQTKALSVLGNHTARPTFTVTATAGKQGSYAYAKALFWYNPTQAANNEPLEVTNGGVNTAALVADNSNKCQVNSGAGISAAVTTIPYGTVTGTIPSSGLVYCGTEQISYTGKTGTTSGNLTGCVRGVNGTTAATHADNAVVYVSKIMANGNDLRVFVDGLEVNRWLSGMNSSATKVWINQQTPARVPMLLNTAIASSGSVTSITVQYLGKGYNQTFGQLPGSFLFAIGSELFTASSIDSNSLTITVSGRSAKNTSMAAHAIGDTIYRVEHDMYLVYGNPNASAPITDDTKKPMFDLSTSTNTSWVHAEFASADNQRTGAWKPAGYMSGARYWLSGYYTGTHNTLANPATEMGIVTNSYYNGGVWKPTSSGSYNTAWTLSHPAGIVTITMTGEKYRYTSEWPVITLNCTYGKVWTERSPASAQVWSSLDTHSAVTVPTFGGVYAPWITLLMSSGLSGTANNMAAVEAQSTTATFGSANVLQYLTAVAENVNFQMDSTIANSTTGESITINMPMELNKTLVINCDDETVIYDGKDVGLPMTWNTVRGPWLDLQAGSNTLTFTDTGTVSGLSIVVTWEDRNTL